MNEVCEIIERGGIAVDDGEQRAAALCNYRERCRGLNLQRRPDDDENVCAFAPALGSLHGLYRHRLTKGDIGGFQKSAADIASRARQRFVPFFINLGRLKNFAAFEARDEPVRAMQLDQPRIRCAGEFVQSIDVLCDQTEQLAALFERANLPVPDVRRDSLEQFIGRFF